MAFNTGHATVIIESLKKSYGKKWTDGHTEGLTEVLAIERHLPMKKQAERVREFVWDAFSGGGTSANATRKAFAEIQHEDACDPRWI